MKGVGRNPKGDGKKKGGLKVHMLTDVHADTPRFVKISEAKMHDKNFLQYLNLSEGSMVVFVKAYNYYLQCIPSAMSVLQEWVKISISLSGPPPMVYSLLQPAH